MRHRLEELFPILVILILAIPLSHAGSNDNPSRYQHDGFLALRGGEGAAEYWAFLPDRPSPREAPVVVFLHGWGGMDPYLYGAWIKHLVLRGNIVIYPRYQTNIKTKFEAMTPGAMKAVQDAYNRLQTEGPVRPSRDLAFVGHSMGGFIAANLAVIAAENGLPEPSALMIVAPGDGDGRMRRLGQKLPLVDMARAPANLAVLLVTGDQDSVVGDRGATKIWQGFKDSPVTRKSFVTIDSIKSKSGSLPSDHFTPLATDPDFRPEFSINPSGKPKDMTSWIERRREARRQRVIRRTRDRWEDRYEPDTMDTQGYWKLFDDLLDSAFDSSGPEGRATRMGKWLEQLDQRRDDVGPAIRRRDDIMNAKGD